MTDCCSHPASIPMSDSNGKAAAAVSTTVTVRLSWWPLSTARFQSDAISSPAVPQAPNWRHRANRLAAGGWRLIDTDLYANCRHSRRQRFTPAGRPRPFQRRRSDLQSPNRSNLRGAGERLALVALTHTTTLTPALTAGERKACPAQPKRATFSGGSGEQKAAQKHSKRLFAYSGPNTKNLVLRRKPCHAQRQPGRKQTASPTCNIAPASTVNTGRIVPPASKRRTHKRRTTPCSPRRRN